MINSCPVQSINEWSCALACVTSFLNTNSISVSQNEIIERFSSHFPKWKHRPGLLTQAELLVLLELFEITPGYILITSDREDFLKAFEKLYKERRYAGGFCFTHNPTNHCRKIT